MSAGPAAPSSADGDRRRWDARHAEGRLDDGPAAWAAAHRDLRGREQDAGGPAVAGIVARRPA